MDYAMDHSHLAPRSRSEKPFVDSQTDHAPRRTSNAHRQSYETGESSTTGSLGEGVTNGHSRLSSDISPGGAHHGGPMVQPPSKEVRSRRKRRQASSNAFLLHDAVATAQDRSSHRQSRNLTQERAKSMLQTPEKAGLSVSAGKSHLSSPEGHPRSVAQASLSSHDNIPRSTTVERVLGPDANHGSDEPHQAPGVDVDSTQIVNMALNLSESRRIASTRRNVSRTHPPGLAPLPDVSQGGSLRQHLQQQRKNSRGGSPRPQLPASPRIPYGTVRTSSPLQAAGSETGQEGSYRWHFTPSTLARAQKAKEQLELMAQYRRLLEVIPPLTSENSRNLSSPPSTPANSVRAVKFGSQSKSVSQGRPYNPLQYIRNRKVRARERKVIDGEGQGFGDVDAVTDWVDTIANHASSTSSPATTGIATHMPRFDGAEASDSQKFSETTTKAAARSRRPRVDWFFDPCDMIADAYWLEQSHHKELIEDRQRRKIFPPTAQISRPLSQQADEANAGTTPYSIKTLEEVSASSGPPVSSPTKSDSQAQTGTREKARQKLHDFKGFHHRHNSSTHGTQDVLKLRKASFSDLSDSDNEVKGNSKQASRRPRAGTLTSDPNDLLQKQMLEILAKEARENQTADVPETVIEQDEPGVGAFRDNSSSSRAASHSRSRNSSAAEALKAVRQARNDAQPSPLQHRAGEMSLDLNDRPRHYSTDDDISAPASPLHEGPGHGIPSFGNATLSPPWSRDGSPVRHRLLKTVTGRHEKRDRRPEHVESIPNDDVGEARSRRDSLAEAGSPEVQGAALDGQHTGPRRGSNEFHPTEGHKGHRSTNSMRLRDEQGVNIRGIFKGPRIDTVLRGGVSKLGDMLWRRDGSSETPQDVDSTDESESEALRGRLRPTISRQVSRRKHVERQTSKHFLDSMPQFQSLGEMYNHGRKDSKNQHEVQNASSSHSRQSSRADLLKPPTHDAGGRSLSVSPPAAGYSSHASESDVSNATSNQRRTSEGVRIADRRLSSVLGLPQLIGQSSSRTNSQSWLDDRRPSAPRAQMSKREMARMKALILSSGIKAMEVSRRAGSEIVPLDSNLRPTEPSIIPWTAIAKMSPEPADLYARAHHRCELYPLAARHLSSTVQYSAQRWQASVERFSSTTSPTLHRRLGNLRSRLANDLSERTRDAADLADETGRDLALTQPLKVKHVQDLVEKMMRRRRRRFRWMRRGMWLGVEWVLVGFMWYVWFVVTILRLVLGAGKAAWTGVRWLLWL
ncbi:hypothetical protein LIA77_00750 [Sarocladium implicatum]|nr:hypothetical protein LIA77_00750 [Sarocladium implicatum]